MPSGKKKFKIELEDAEGTKYNFSLEGNVSKDNMMKIVEFMNLLNLETEPSPTDELEARVPASIGEKIWTLVESKFSYASFTSSDVLELYEDTYNEPIKLSIISTYLSRYAERGVLSRIRQGKEWVYKNSRQQSGPLTAPQRRPFLSTSPDQPQ
jgi:hypothetical protein